MSAHQLLGISFVLQQFAFSPSQPFDCFNSRSAKSARFVDQMNKCASYISGCSSNSDVSHADWESWRKKYLFSSGSPCWKACRQCRLMPPPSRSAPEPRCLPREWEHDVFSRVSYAGCVLLLWRPRFGSVGCGTQAQAQEQSNGVWTPSYASVWCGSSLER